MKLSRWLINSHNILWTHTFLLPLSTNPPSNPLIHQHSNSHSLSNPPVPCSFYLLSCFPFSYLLLVTFIFYLVIQPSSCPLPCFFFLFPAGVNVTVRPQISEFEKAADTPIPFISSCLFSLLRFRQYSSVINLFDQFRELSYAQALMQPVLITLGRDWLGPLLLLIFLFILGHLREGGSYDLDC